MMEIQDLQKSPPEGIMVLFNEENVTEIEALILGPGYY